MSSLSRQRRALELEQLGSASALVVRRRVAQHQSLSAPVVDFAQYGAQPGHGFESVHRCFEKDAGAVWNDGVPGKVIAGRKRRIKCDEFNPGPRFIVTPLVTRESVADRRQPSGAGVKLTVQNKASGQLLDKPSRRVELVPFTAPKRAAIPKTPQPVKLLLHKPTIQALACIVGSVREAFCVHGESFAKPNQSCKTVFSCK